MSSESQKKHIHHLVWVNQGNSAISVKIGEKNLKSLHPNIHGLHLPLACLVILGKYYLVDRAKFDRKYFFYKVMMSDQNFSVQVFSGHLIFEKIFTFIDNIFLGNLVQNLKQLLNCTFQAKLGWQDPAG